MDVSAVLVCDCKYCKYASKIYDKFIIYTNNVRPPLKSICAISKQFNAYRESVTTTCHSSSCHLYNRTTETLHICKQCQFKYCKVCMYSRRKILCILGVNKGILDKTSICEDCYFNRRVQLACCPGVSIPYKYAYYCIDCNKRICAMHAKKNLCMDCYKKMYKCKYCDTIFCRSNYMFIEKCGHDTSICPTCIYKRRFIICAICRRTNICMNKYMACDVCYKMQEILTCGEYMHDKLNKCKYTICKLSNTQLCTQCMKCCMSCKTLVNKKYCDIICYKCKISIYRIVTWWRHHCYKPTGVMANKLYKKYGNKLVSLGDSV